MSSLILRGGSLEGYAKKHRIRKANEICGKNVIIPFCSVVTVCVYNRR